MILSICVYIVFVKRNIYFLFLCIILLQAYFIYGSLYYFKIYSMHTYFKRLLSHTNDTNKFIFLLLVSIHEICQEHLDNPRTSYYRFFYAYIHISVTVNIRYIIYFILIVAKLNESLLKCLHFQFFIQDKKRIRLYCPIYVLSKGFPCGCSSAFGACLSLRNGG